jgi:hypothetical protein
MSTALRASRTSPRKTRRSEASERRAGLQWLTVALAALAFGCSFESAGSGGADAGSGKASGGRDGGSAAADASEAPPPTSTSTPTPSADGGSAKVCRIATLGFRGEWGNGDVFANWLKGESTQGTTPLEDRVLTADLLSAYQIIVVEDVRPGQQGQPGVGQGIGRSYSADEVEALRQWVAQGGGLMTLTGYATNSSEIANVNALLASFGMSYGTTAILGAGGGTTPVTHWADHPLAKGITQIGVNNGYPVQGDGATLIAWEPTPGQYDVGRALEYQSGHVLVWGDEWITYNSEWNQHPDYQVSQFWINILNWLSPISQCEAPIPIGPN